MASCPSPDPAHWIRLRILDANANRAAEGLRVVEEFARFGLDDPLLAGLFKDLRHRLASALQGLPPGERLAARDTAGDVGTELQTTSEYARPDLESIVQANLARVEQALRCLEEYAKGYQPALAIAAERLRYDVYTASSAVLRSPAHRQRLASARLYVLIDGERDLDRFAARAAALVAAGVHVLQLRDKTLPDRVLVERAARLRQITASSSTLFIMNDRPDLAAIVDADGVHVGQEELRVRDVRRVAGTQRLVGVSTHDLSQARQAVLDGADYLGCGPLFPSATKSFDAFPGLDFLRQVAAEIRLPAFAIGGIDQARLPAVLAAGGTRVAISSAIWRAEDPAAAAREFLTRLPAASTPASVASGDASSAASAVESADRVS